MVAAPPQRQQRLQGRRAQSPGDRLHAIERGGRHVEGRDVQLADVSSALPVASPAWWAMNCRVRVARTATPGTVPHAPSTPDVRSSDSTGAPLRAMAVTKAANPPASRPS